MTIGMKIAVTGAIVAAVMALVAQSYPNDRPPLWFAAIVGILFLAGLCAMFGGALWAVWA